MQSSSKKTRTDAFQGNGGCDQICENLEGGHECRCRSGFALSGDGATCVDVDECSSGYSDCDQRCVNTEGSYSCECEEGFRADELDPRRCISIAVIETDPCSACSHSCNDVGEVTER